MHFIGYCEETKGYRLYNPQTEKLMISRDVLFDEKEEWQWNHYVQQQTPSIFVQEDESFVSANPSSNQNTSKARSTPSSSTTSSHVSSPSPPPKRTKYLNEIYGYTNFALMSHIEEELRCFEDAVEELVLCKSMDEEMATIKKNATWELMDPPTKKEVIGVKWLYKTKYAADGSIQRHKEMLVANGYAQQSGIDYNETYSPLQDLIQSELFWHWQHNIIG